MTLRSKLNCDGLAPVALIYPWPLSIPWMTISAYAERYGVADIDEFELFADMVRACDEAYLAAVRDR